MDKFKITKWFGNKIVEIAGVLATVIGIVVSIILAVASWGGKMNTVIGCAVNDVLCIGINGLGLVLGITFAALISMLLVSVSADTMIIISTSNFPKISHWIKTPHSKNLYVSSGELHGNIFTLKFRNAEWRYPFKKINAFATIQSMAKLYALDNLEWRNTKQTEPIFIKRFRSYELNFIEVDNKNNKFSVITNSDKKFYFGIGKYGFDICSYTNIFGNFKVKGNMFVNSIGHKTAFNEQYIIVDYKGKNDISAKVVDRETAQKVMWFSKFKTPENNGEA